MTKYVEEETHGIIGLVHITKPELGSVRVPLPPAHQQVLIASWIEQQVGRLNAIIDRAQREIALIREYRERLIADVVTGKIDVRGVSLPDAGGDEAAEEALLDPGEFEDEADEALPEEAEA